MRSHRSIVSAGRFAALACGWPLLAIAGIVLDPDVRQATIARTICMPGYTKSVRPSTVYTSGVKRRLLREAGVDASHAGDYELDHVVPLALGGHPRSLENLRLQPWEGSAGAKRKDRIEVKMQCLVCAGRLPLASAQQAIYADWQDAEHRYASMKCAARGRRALAGDD